MKALKKKNIMKVLIATIIFTCFVVVDVTATTGNSAEQDLDNRKVTIEKQEIIDIMAQLSELRSKNLLQQAITNNKQNRNIDFERKETELEKRLASLGVNRISDTEVRALMKNTRFDLPPTTDSIKWYDYDIIVYRDGKRYDVQEVYAQGLDGNSSLALGKDGHIMYSNKKIIVNELKNIASIYAQKAISLIPIVSWLPYELLFVSGDNATINSSNITYRSLSTVCFSYVNEQGKPQELSFISNTYDIAASHTYAGYKDGKPFADPVSTYNVVYADRYASTSAAVDSYVEICAPSLSFSDTFEFREYDDNGNILATHKVYPITPLYPFQVY